MDTFVQTLYCTTDIGAQRPIHKCGKPMSKAHVKNGKQEWCCCRFSCNEPIRKYNYKTKEKKASRLRTMYWKDPERSRERARRESRERYWGDPWRPLKLQQARREWYARKREERMNGG